MIILTLRLWERLVTAIFAALARWPFSTKRCTCSKVGAPERPHYLGIRLLLGC